MTNVRGQRRTAANARTEGGSDGAVQTQTAQIQQADAATQQLPGWGGPSARCAARQRNSGAARPADGRRG
eukprot:7618833-Lingulodinium_polyedra.AAC.1